MMSVGDCDTHISRLARPVRNPLTINNKKETSHEEQY